MNSVPWLLIQFLLFLSLAFGSSAIASERTEKSGAISCKNSSLVVPHSMLNPADIARADTNHIVLDSNISRLYLPMGILKWKLLKHLKPEGIIKLQSKLSEFLRREFREYIEDIGKIENSYQEEGPYLEELHQIIDLIILHQKIIQSFEPASKERETQSLVNLLPPGLENFLSMFSEKLRHNSKAYEEILTAVKWIKQSVLFIPNQFGLEEFNFFITPKTLTENFFPDLRLNTDKNELSFTYQRNGSNSFFPHLFEDQKDFVMSLKNHEVLKEASSDNSPLSKSIDGLLQQVQFGKKGKQDGLSDSQIAKSLILEAADSDIRVNFTTYDKDFLKGFMRLEYLTLIGWTEQDVLGPKFNLEWEKYVFSDSVHWYSYKGKYFLSKLFYIEFEKGKDVEISLVIVQDKKPNSKNILELSQYIQLESSLNELVQSIHLNQRLYNSGLKEVDPTLFERLKAYDQEMREYYQLSKALKEASNQSERAAINRQINSLQKNLSLEPEIDFHIHEFVFTRFRLNSTFYKSD
ncbi:MAG: hypothetical protein VX642_09685 [Bdellovibrionota bacterium]|nr:hypothetical protein [Bdellovibrionota bacterium]